MTIKSIRSVKMSARALPAVMLLLGSLLLFIAPAAAQTSPQQPKLPGETPAKLEPTNDGFDYVRRDVMIPMRDGVKLHTVILMPKGAHRAPILLTRTPYNATALTSHFVPNIFWAKPGDYRKATQRIYHAPGHDHKLASSIELPVVTTP